VFVISKKIYLIFKKFPVILVVSSFW